MKYGHRVSKPRIARLMRANNLFARRRSKFIFTTDTNHNYPIAPNLLNQDFTVDKENQIFDITYIQTKEGWGVYLTIIIDLFNRKVVGWALSDNLSTESTIIPAWNMPIKDNKITEERNSIS